MADSKLVELLRQGAAVWNPYFEERRRTESMWTADLMGAKLARADLTGAVLTGADLTGADFRKANLEDVNLRGSILTRADLTRGDFTRTNLSRTDLVETDFTLAKLTNADFTDAGLTSADFTLANLTNVDFTDAYLVHADLTRANLTSAKFTRANLTSAKFTRANLQQTSFSGIDLSTVNGLTSVFHQFGSNISTSTLVRSRGKIPDVFLKGCGLADWEILNARLYDPDLPDDRRIDIAYQLATLSAAAPIQPHPVFISYTHGDSQFVDQLQDALDKRGVRSWRDIHQAESGPLEKVIDRAISLNPTMVLVLSEASANSDWVPWEVMKAVKLERELGRAVLCPVALDDTWRRCSWPAWMRQKLEEYSILDFSAEDALQTQMPRLLQGLHIHYREGHGNG